MQIGDFLNRLQKVKTLAGGEYQACCPAHKDMKPSLSVAFKDGKILVDCKAGCKVEDIVTSLNLTMSDLFVEQKAVATKVIPKIVAEYDYKDEQGNVLYQVVRYQPKDFRQRHKNGNGEWVWDLKGVRRVLYHLPDLLLDPASTVHVVEGEKDCDNLWNVGLIATTSPCGAGAWRDEYADYLKGHKVVIIPDKDAAGYAYARQAANALIDKAREIKVIILPGDNVKDATDWLEAGGDVSLLTELEQDVAILFASDKPAYRMVNESIQWNKKIDSLLLTFTAERISEERTGIHARVAICGQHESLSWSYLNIERREDRSSLAGAAHQVLKTDVTYGKDDLRRDLDSFCAGLWEFNLSRFGGVDMVGDETPLPLSYYLKPYILEGGGTILFAPPGRGKSYMALLWAVSIDAGCNLFWDTQPHKVYFINLERSGESLRRRLSMVNKALGLPATRPLFTLNAKGKNLSEVLPVCRRDIAKKHVEIVFLDSISRAGLGDLNENQSGNKIIDALSAISPTWVALGHTSRASEEHMYGSIMQDAGADICVQLASQIKADEGTLGIGLQITKQNDTGYHGQKIYALQFGDDILNTIRLAKTFEFPEIEGKNMPDMLTTVIEWISNRESGDATATEVENELGFNRINVCRMFTQSGRFSQTRKVKQSVYYGVKSIINDMEVV